MFTFNIGSLPVEGKAFRKAVRRRWGTGGAVPSMSEGARHDSSYKAFPRDKVLLSSVLAAFATQQCSVSLTMLSPAKGI